MAIYMPQDPRHPDLSKTAAGLTRMQEKGQKKGMLEFMLMQEYGGVIPAGEMSKRAKTLGISESTLMNIMEPIRTREGAGEMLGEEFAENIAGYKMKGRSEKALEQTEKIEKLKRMLEKLFASGRLKEKVAETKAVTMAGVPAKGAVIKTQIEATGKLQTEMESLRQQNKIDIINLKENLNKEKDKTTIANIQSQISLREKQGKLYDAQANWFATGKDEAKTRFVKFMEAANLERLGFIEIKKSAGKSIKLYKAYKKGGAEYIQQKAKLDAAGVIYKEVSEERKNQIEPFWGIIGSINLPWTGKDKIIFVPIGMKSIGGHTEAVIRSNRFTAPGGTAENPLLMRY